MKPGHQWHDNFIYFYIKIIKYVKDIHWIRVVVNQVNGVV